MSSGTITENEHYLKAKGTLGKPGPGGAGLWCQVFKKAEEASHQVSNTSLGSSPIRRRKGREEKYKNHVCKGKNIYLAEQKHCLGGEANHKIQKGVQQTSEDLVKLNILFTAPKQN